MLRRNKAGFTFIELIVVIGIIVIVGGIAFSYLSGMHSKVQPGTIENLQAIIKQKNFNDAMAELIRGSREIIRPHQGESLPFAVLKTSTNEILCIYNEKISEELGFITYSYIHDYLNPGNLKNRKKIGENVTDLSFTSDSPLSLVIKGAIIHEGRPKYFLTEIGLRNIGGD
jgi:prepilin-type N-terminal cleavage/methylation domain-containing protein